jgi:TolB-like protein
MKGNALICRSAGLLAFGVTLAVPAIAFAQADTRPIVAVLSFDNNSIGKDAHDYDGVSKGIMELLATDLAGNPKFRVVERERVQKILEEQNLTKSGAIDPATAVRVGKMLGAQYAIYGGFMNTGKQMVLTLHSTDMETSQITNPEKVQGAGDDVLALIGQASSKMSSNMKLDVKPGTGSRPSGGSSMGGAAQMGTPAPATSTGGTEQYAKALPAEAKKVKLDMQYLKIYSNALDAIDKKDKSTAIKLLNQVKAQYPGFTPAQDNLTKLGA